MIPATATAPADSVYVFVSGMFDTTLASETLLRPHPNMHWGAIVAFGMLALLFVFLRVVLKARRR